MHKLIQAHYGVRYHIAKCLEDRQERVHAGKFPNVSLALCYELGFGIPRGVHKSSPEGSNLDSVAIQRLELEIERIKSMTKVPDFQDGLFDCFLKQGHFSTFDPNQQYREERSFSEAEERLHREIESIGLVLGKKHLIVQELRRQLSLVLSSQGKWNDAEDLQLQMARFEEGAEIAYDKIGGTNLLLASTYRYQGRWEDAKAMELKVVEMRERILGREHPETLKSLANLASTYWHLGQWKEAEDLELSITQISRDILGPKHPRTLLIMANLAGTYRSQGKRDRAERIDLEVINTRKSVLGDEHPDTLVSTDNLALTYS